MNQHRCPERSGFFFQELKNAAHGEKAQQLRRHERYHIRHCDRSPVRIGKKMHDREQKIRRQIADIWLLAPDQIYANASHNKLFRKGNKHRVIQINRELQRHRVILSNRTLQNYRKIQ